MLRGKTLVQPFQSSPAVALKGMANGGYHSPLSLGHEDDTDTSAAGSGDQGEVLIPFRLSEEAEKGTPKLEDRLRQLDTEHELKFPQGYVSISDLEREFKALKRITPRTEKEKDALEEYHLAMMKALQTHINTSYRITAPKLPEPEPSPGPWQRFGFVFFILFEIGLTLIGGYLGLVEILAYGKDYLSDLATNAIIGGLLSVEVIMFYALMAPILKVALGFPHKKPSKICSLHTEQIEVAENLNQMLVFDPLRMGLMQKQHYAQYTRLLKLFNGSLEDRVEEYKEKWYWVGLRWLLTGFSFLLTAAHAYFMASSLVAKINVGIVLATKTAEGVVLAFTAPAWGIIGFIVGGVILYRLIVRWDTVDKMINPMKPVVKGLREKFEQFGENRKDRNSRIKYNLSHSSIPQDFARAEYATRAMKLRRNLSERNEDKELLKARGLIKGKRLIREKNRIEAMKLIETKIEAVKLIEDKKLIQNELIGKNNRVILVKKTTKTLPVAEKQPLASSTPVSLPLETLAAEQLPGVVLQAEPDDDRRERKISISHSGNESLVSVSGASIATTEIGSDSDSEGVNDRSELSVTSPVRENGDKEEFKRSEKSNGSKTPASVPTLALGDDHRTLTKAGRGFRPLDLETRSLARSGYNIMRFYRNVRAKDRESAAPAVLLEKKI